MSVPGLLARLGAVGVERERGDGREGVGGGGGGGGRNANGKFPDRMAVVFSPFWRESAEKVTVQGT